MRTEISCFTSRLFGQMRTGCRLEPPPKILEIVAVSWPFRGRFVAVSWPFRSRFVDLRNGHETAEALGKSYETREPPFGVINIIYPQTGGDLFRNHFPLIRRFVLLFRNCFVMFRHCFVCVSPGANAMKYYQ